jgi:plastocyanin
MTKLFVVILAGLALGLGLAACGGDDDDSGGTGGGGAATTEEPASGGGGGAQVSLKNIQFNPKDITVKPGETITFTNDESIPHDVHKTSGPGPDFSSGGDGGMQQGDTFELKLDKPGKYQYVCTCTRPAWRAPHRQVGRRANAEEPRKQEQRGLTEFPPARRPSRPSWGSRRS